VRYLSLFSGIEAASVAWLPLGWECVGVAEIDPFPSAVLRHHYVNVPNLGNISAITPEMVAALGRIDLVAGGFPCQDVSVAGKRKGLKNDDGTVTRSGLFFDAMRIVRWADPRWLLLENVPGIYSSNGGRDFADVVGEVLGVSFDVPPDGWKTAGVAASERGLLEWATLDAQFFGVPQRRRRLFALADFGDWAGRSPVLFERASLSGHPAPRREAGQVAPTLPARRSAGGGLGTDFDTDGGLIASTGPISHCLNAGGFDASEDGTGRGTPLIAEPYTLAIRGRGDSHDLEYRQDGVANAILTPNGGRGGIGVGAVAFDARQSNVLQYGNLSGPLDTNGTSIAVAFAENQRAELTLNDTAGSLKVGGGKPGQGYPAVMQHMAVRRLTPRECERLQGFPDDYTAIPYRGKLAADGPRYKALGNSMAVPVMHWIGRRIQQVEELS
jgi:DNA (cytosine-5)-methyltransferase 1